MVLTSENIQRLLLKGVYRKLCVVLRRKVQQKEQLLVLLWCCSPHPSERDQKLPLFMSPSTCNRGGLTLPRPCSQSPIFLWSLWTEQVGLGPGRRTKAKCSVTLQTYEDNIAYLPRVGHDVLAKRTTTDFTYPSKFLGCNGNWKTSSWKLLKRQTWYENDWVGEVIFMSPQWGCLTLQILLLWLTSETMYTQILIKTNVWNPRHQFPDITE